MSVIAKPFSIADVTASTPVGGPNAVNKARLLSYILTNNTATAATVTICDNGGTAAGSTVNFPVSIAANASVETPNFGNEGVIYKGQLTVASSQSVSGIFLFSDLE